MVDVVAMSAFEKYHVPSLRSYAVKIVLDHVRAEDLNSKFIGIGPVSSFPRISSHK